MRVLYIGAFRFPCFDAAAARVLNVARSLRLAGHEVCFISWGGKYRESDLCEDGNYRVDGFEYVITDELDVKGSVITRLKAKLSQGEKTKKLVNRRASETDVIITYNGSIIRWLLKFTRRRHIKLINDMTEWYSRSELKVIDWIPLEIGMRTTQKRVANKIVISSYLDHYYNMTHNIVLPATCDASEEKWNEVYVYASTQIKPFQGITLIYAGTPAKKDLVHSVVNAVHRLAEEGSAIRFIVLGIDRSDYLSANGPMLRTKNLHKNIIFLGRMPQDVIPSFYHQADFMVLLREQNRKSNAGFPTKFAESFTSGIPVIANLTSDLDKYLINGETGFVVDEPTEGAIYRTLKEQVLPLEESEIARMKNKVLKASRRFDYHFYVEPLRQFMDYLK